MYLNIDELLCVEICFNMNRSIFDYFRKLKSTRIVTFAYFVDFIEQGHILIFFLHIEIYKKCS